MKNFFVSTGTLILLFLFSSCQKDPGGELILMQARPDAGFNYPYYLFIPDEVIKNRSIHMVIEPNNSGFVDDDLQKHIDKASRTASLDFYVGNFLARARRCPQLVPAFPRSKTNWVVYTHALDRDAILETDTMLQRIDLQLIAMFEDAKSKLKERNIIIHDQFLMTGFSASGSFANRFAVLHPDKVAAVAAGGVNGLLMLPVDSLEESALPFPLGTSDYEAITGKPFDIEAFQQTPQYYFMGLLDDNDAIPYDDGYNQQERALVYKLLGKEMMPARWHACRNIYDSMDVNAVIRTYPATGHEQSEEIKQDVVDFFNKNIPVN